MSLSVKAKVLCGPHDPLACLPISGFMSTTVLSLCPQAGNTMPHALNTCECSFPSGSTLTFLLLKKKIIYLFMRDREREAETQAEGEAAPCGEPDVGLDPRSQDHALSRRQMLNR